LTKLPWEYLFDPFRGSTKDHPGFADLFMPVWVASLVLLVILIVLYTARTRALHRHKAYLDMYEWLFWTGLITFSLLLVESVFAFDFFLVLATIAVGLGTLVWVRFLRFPPILAAYEHRLARQRYFSRTKFQRPEATIRPKSARRSRRRR
jgi:hypothetical protein